MDANAPSFSTCPQKNERTEGIIYENKRKLLVFVEKLVIGILFLWQSWIIMLAGKKFFFSMALSKTHTQTHKHTYHKQIKTKWVIRVNKEKAKLKAIIRLKLKFSVLHPRVFSALWSEAFSVTIGKDRNQNNTKKEIARKSYKKFLKWEEKLPFSPFLLILNSHRDTYTSLPLYNLEKTKLKKLKCPSLLPVWHTENNICNYCGDTINEICYLTF